MNEYRFDLPVTAEQLQAIGMVAAEWWYLEGVVDAAIWQLAAVGDEETGHAITAHLTLPIRLGILATLSDLAFKKGWDTADRSAALKPIRTVVTESLTRRRAEAVHGRWLPGRVWFANGVHCPGSRCAENIETRDTC